MCVGVPPGIAPSEVLSQWQVQGHSRSKAPPSCLPVSPFNPLDGKDRTGREMWKDSQLSLELSNGDPLALLTLSKPRAKMKNRLEPSVVGVMSPFGCLCSHRL